MGLKPEEFDPKPVKDSSGQDVMPSVINVGPPETWRVVQRSCAAGQHSMVPDESEQDFEAEVCTRCHIGRLIRRKT